MPCPSALTNSHCPARALWKEHSQNSKGPNGHLRRLLYPHKKEPCFLLGARGSRVLKTLLSGWCAKLCVCSWTPVVHPILKVTLCLFSHMEGFYSNMSQMTSLPSSKPFGGSAVPQNKVQILHHGPQGFSPTLLSLGSLFLLPSPLADSTPAMPLFLQHIKHAYASGPLHWLRPLPGSLFPRYPHIPFLHLRQVLMK